MSSIFSTPMSAVTGEDNGGHPTPGWHLTSWLIDILYFPPEAYNTPGTWPEMEPSEEPADPSDPMSYDTQDRGVTPVNAGSRAMPASDLCPEIDLGPDVALDDCFDPCSNVSLTADVTQTRETTSYTVSEITPFALPYATNFGTPLTFASNNEWSPVISLPFNFCFYGNTYNEILVGTNGILTFNTVDAGLFCPNSIPLGESIPSTSPAIPKNAIFAPFVNLDPSIDGSISYGIDGTAPCRKLVVNYDGVASASCFTSVFVSIQIVLHEATNIIDIYANGLLLPCSSASGGRAILGIQNAAGTQGVAGGNPIVNGQNTAFSFEGGWRFAPDGASTVTVDWFEQGGTFLGTGQTIDVCPGEATQSYVAEATFSNCDGSSIVVSDDITITCAQILAPVEWLGFEATLSEDARSVACRWQTASELNNDFFTVQRSADGVNWNDLANIDGAGTTSEAQHYQWIDLDPLQGVSYYRIRQTDYNGDTDYSPKDAVVRDGEDLTLQVYPNPGTGVFTIDGLDAEAIVRVYDMSGRQVDYVRIGEKQIDLRGAASGHYIFEVQRGERIEPKRLLVQLYR